MKSSELFSRAQRVIPGGVNSPVRAFHGVGGAPVFFAEGAGAWLADVDGRRYADYVCSWGAIVAGHARAEVVAAVSQTAAKGMGFGAPHENECRFAETLCAAVPSLETVRAVNSGTEATMSAIRVARGFCRRDLLVKFDGCYHGHSDSLLVAAGSGALTLGKPSSGGVPAAIAGCTISLPYNAPQAAEELFARRGDEIAAVIVEPVAGNMNMVRGTPEFLQTLRALCDKHGAVLIFDEVMSGFRIARGGAQEIYGIAPDLICLGKVIGGGLGVAAFGGRRDIMRILAPEGDVYQAGTLAGNPVAMAAGLAVLQIALADGFYAALSAAATAVREAMTAAAQKYDAPFCADSLGGMLGFYFRRTPPANLTDARDCDDELFRKFFHLMLSRGVYLAPSAFEAAFVTAAHDSEVVAHTAAAAEESFAEIMRLPISAQK